MLVPCRSIPGRAGGLQPLKIRRPELLLVFAELVEVVPGVDAGAVPVGEHRLDRVRAYRLDGPDLDVALARLQHFLSRPMAAHFRRRRVDTQELVRQAKAAPIGEGDFQYPRLLVQRDAGRCALRSHCAFSYATRS